MNKQKIAVIGSGIAGLSTSFFLSKFFDVHLFEKNSKLGGHTRTVNFTHNNKELSIDTGFIVFNEKNYPDLTSFFKYLKVPTENSNMSFSVSSTLPNIEYGGSSLNTLFAQRKNIFSIKFILLIYEIMKFYKKSKKIIEKKYNENLTIEEFLIENNFSKHIRQLHIYPMISSIWSTNEMDVKNFPFIFFLKFFSNHGLFDLNNRPQWKYVLNGSYSYIDSLIKKNLFSYTLNSTIKTVLRRGGKIYLVDENNKENIFDKIIFANHADQALKLLDSPTKEEKNILSNFNYTSSKAFLHFDDRFMPKKTLAWSSWNFLQNTNNIDSFSLTYWMNRLQNIKESTNFFVTINPNIRPNNIIDSTLFEHPVFNLNTIQAQKELSLIQGIKNTYFCGSYCGYGFHEDGIQSAAYISKILNVELPWTRSVHFKTRLTY